MAAKAKPAGAPANPHRGEITVTLGGADYVLRPTFEAMVAIEEQIGALTVITQRLRSGAGALTLTETAVIITECMKAHGRATKNQLAANARAESVAKMIFAAGVVQIVPVIFPLLTKMLTGGATADEGNG